MLIERLSSLLDQLGVDWILILLILLSILSVGLVIERLLFLRRNTVPVRALQHPLAKALRESPEAAKKVLSGYSGMETVVTSAGIDEISRGVAAVEEVMAATEALERQRYERFLSFLASVGSNAPFIGLLGTVIGIMGAFADLQVSMSATADANRTQAIMGSISEALVATAVGLFVAIPAVWAYNQLRTKVKQVHGNTAALSGIVLAHLKTEANGSTNAASESS